MALDDKKELWLSLREDFPKLLDFTLSLAAALCILFAGMIVARWARKRFRKSTFGGQQIDATLRPVIASVIFYIILSATLYAVLTKIGVPATALLAIFGSAGLAIGLALKDTLGNIASGVMLLTLRPLQVGEYVETMNFAGTIIEIGLFSTTLKTADGLYTYVPNSAVWNNRLTNYGRHSQRRLTVNIGVAYRTNLTEAQDILLEVLKSAADVLDTPAPPQCFVTEFGDCAITLSCRCWIPSDNWQGRSSVIRRDLKTALDRAKIDIPYPHAGVTMGPN